MRIAVFLDHDITIRHFVLSDVLETLRAKHDVMFFFPRQHRRVRLNLALPLLMSCYQTIPIDEQRAFRQRRLYQATVLRNLRGGVEREMMRKLWYQMLGRRGYHETRVLSWPGIYHLYRAWSEARIGENGELDARLRAYQPDLILHPTVLEGLFVADLARWGKQHGVPTVYIMNSWDNPATKAMIAEHPDKLIVWGEHSERDAIRHMRTPRESIIRLGAAQYDVYRQPPRVPPAEWRKRLGIPEDKLILLYAGSNQGLNETEHLRLLDDAIERGFPSILKTCEVIYRPHPWRPYPKEEEGFFTRRWKHVRMDPASVASYNESRTSGRVMVELADYADTHSTLSAVDAVVSPLSSILLEAALHGLPVAAYTAGLPIRHFYQTFFEHVPCRRVYGPDRLVDTCARMLHDARDPVIAERNQKACAYFVEPSDRPYGERLEEVLRGL